MARFKFERTVALNFGEAKYDQMELVPVGDRFVPQHISVHFPGDDDQPTLDLGIDIIGGVPMCTELKMAKKPDGREVRSKDLRIIRIEDWLEYIVAACSHSYETDGSATTIRDHPNDGPTAADKRRVSDVRQPVRNANRGRRSIDREFLERVAAVYRDHFDDRPGVAIEKAFGVKKRTAAWYVELCRSDNYKLLPKTESKGKKQK
jgi:hypothetical protein